MTAPRFLSAQTWRTNAELIAAVAVLYELGGLRNAVDVTYGAGGWWKAWEPAGLVRHGLALESPEHYDDGVDFTALPEPDDTYDLAAFDPPYVSIGGRTTQGAAGAEQAARFGMASSASNPADNQALIDAGLAELWRVLRPCRRSAGRARTGIALVKCQDYITAGRLWPGVHRTLTAAEAVGFRIEDIIEHVRPSAGPQPLTNRDGTRRRQMHAHRNHSTLLILTKGPAPASPEVEAWISAGDRLAEAATATTTTKGTK